MLYRIYSIAGALDINGSGPSTVSLGSQTSNHLVSSYQPCVSLPSSLFVEESSALCVDMEAGRQSSTERTKRGRGYEWSDEVKFVAVVRLNLFV